MKSGNFFPLLWTALALSLCASAASAEPVTVRHVVRQNFAGSQSPDDARAAALAKAKREVLEKAGTYIDSVKVVRDRQLAHNQIVALSAAVLQAEIVAQKNCISGETFCVEIEATVSVDTADLERRIKKFLDERSALEKAERLEQRERELLAKIDELEGRYRHLSGGAAETGKEKGGEQEASREFREAARSLKAVEANRKAMALFGGGMFSDPEEALSLLNEAISMDPAFSDSFNNRGILHATQREPARAIQDFEQAIKLDPHNADALCNSGNAYTELGKYDRALDRFNAAIKADPGNADSYFNRGYAALKSEAYASAIEDFDRVLTSNGKDAEAYKYRGLAFLMIGDRQKFCADLQAACKVGSCEALEKAREEGECK
ncbi:tetratricopeptide repeat protein [Geomonas sp. RF6]|uniref:tetratricopeptide repeat protein n=1 Tax=Geomonas sp. RF6 TaxID=2897342 RepID=UPI001E3E9197|nr:tetratricopeptide repeat protein [Geomonas sp. RF6]UFS71716.1 tetratricopeptide repeat protein [Geomonas sp. RF6]